jgi:hypothetical protein
MMPRLKQDELYAKLVGTLKQIRLYDAGLRTEWYWIKNILAQAILASDPQVGAVTLGSDQFYRAGEYPSQPGPSSIALIAHETFHSLHAQDLGTGLFLMAYGIDSLAAWWYEGDAYRKNMSEMVGYAVEDTVRDILRKYPEALDWFDANSPRYGQIPAGFAEWVKKRFLENLNRQLQRNR